MRGISAIGKLLAVGVLVMVFFGGMAGVIYYSLQGVEIKVPEITGKNFAESERELASLGLKIKKRADRVSEGPPNTVIEQLPKPGDTVKTGQWIYVVTSKAAAEGDIVPPVLKKTGDDDDADKIEEMISDKPKKPKANSNTNRKKADTTRDVSSNTATSGTNSNTAAGNSNKKEPGTGDPPADKNNKNSDGPGGKPGTPSGGRTTDTKPKTPSRPN